MNTLPRRLRILTSICGAGALGLGVAFWLGYARSLTQLHIAFGIGVVLSLWALAAIAWRGPAHRGLVAFGVVWGLVIWVFGLEQYGILRGASHWIVEVAHLTAGIIAVALAGRLAKALTARGAPPTTSG
jgi:hypothetical protein